MKILYVADGRSPIAQNWIRHFVERGDEIYLASTFACSPDFAVREMEITPVAFSSVKKVTQRPGTAPARTVGLRTAIRQWFGPLTIRKAAPRLREFVERIKPDLVHAMRIPYEGMLAADAYVGMPLLISTWGNDFTLHGPSTRLMKHYTRWTMQVARCPARRLPPRRPPGQRMGIWDQEAQPGGTGKWRGPQRFFLSTCRTDSSASSH